MRRWVDGLDTPTIMRIGLLWLAVGAVLATGAELALLAHWDGTLQLLPWMALAAALVGIVLIAARTGPVAVRIARLLGLVVLTLGGVGVIVHVIQNHDAGILDYRFSATWSTMGDLQQWWLAATGAVGPSPPLAPASLTFAALLVLLASVRVPYRVPAARRGEAAARTLGYDDGSPP